MSKKKRKKYPKLPSGFGSIRYLGEKRRNCYAVHPPSTIDVLGHVNRPAAICYVDDWIKGFTVLTAYKAGTYKPGMEKELEVANTGDADVLVQRIISDYSTIKGVEDKHPEIHELTFEEVYKKFYKWKFIDNKEQTISDSRRKGLISGYKHCMPLYTKTFSSLTHRDFQDFIDSLDVKFGVAHTIVSLIKQMSKYAVLYEYCKENKARHLKANKDNSDLKHAVPFSDEELATLWKHSDDTTVEFLLIMCYSGYRISAYQTIEVNLSENYFKGGVKTASSKDRIVPIHSSILPLVKRRINRDGSMLTLSLMGYRRRMDKILNELKIVGHTPHSCRHTFSMLCEKYEVNENDRKRMMGHSFGGDITNSVYGHRTVEELREQIEKIQVPFVTNCD